MALYNCLRSYSARTELILLSLTYNPTDCVFYLLLNSEMLSVKAREAADMPPIFKVFGMTQLRIKPSLYQLRRLGLILR